MVLGGFATGGLQMRDYLPFAVVFVPICLWATPALALIPVPVPEPTSLGLLASGIAALIVSVRFWRKR